jgi:4-hydroxy 2-oxovalerate aldolase
VSNQSIIMLDCTLRDGGYYNNWDFDAELVQDYLRAMVGIAADYVELGFRGFETSGFRGAYAYTTDSFLRSLEIPDSLRIGVMVNASEVLNHPAGLLPALELLFVPAAASPVELVRLACHVHEFAAALPACDWLKAQGYRVGINLMQIADRQPEDIEHLARLAQGHALDVLYFADSMGSLSPAQTSQIIQALRQGWHGTLGIHTHDNCGMALANTLRAVEDGVLWLDSTVTGMGRGPGNARIEYLVIELMSKRGRPMQIAPLLSLIVRHFQPLQQRYGWGTNPYYFLAGTYGIHPTYIQEMLADSRYAEEDLLVVIEFLKHQGGKKYSPGTLESARHFYSGEPRGSWSPKSMIEDREVLLLGSGPGVARHRQGLENYIRRAKPFVIALNTQDHLAAELIDVRAACHPFRLMADCQEHRRLPQPLVTPAHMLPAEVRESLAGKELLDFGISVQAGHFYFAEQHCTLPTSLVAAYALAIAASGRASRVLLAGFDGYAADDPRSVEVNQLLEAFQLLPAVPALLAVTPSRYKIPLGSIYAL